MTNAQKPKSLDLESSDNLPKRKKMNRQQSAALGPDTKIYVVWLESFEDYENFPIGDLVGVTQTGLETLGMTASAKNAYMASEKDVTVIFIHALQSGLFRIHIQGQPSRISLAIPLVSGMVVSRRTLGTLVRQTAINIGRRRRLDSEAYQPPHVRRKLKIQDLVNKYRHKLAEADFYTSLFQDP